MTNLLVQWFLSALALLVAAKLVPGFRVHGLFAAFVAAAVIGLLNATVGFVLKLLTFPLSLVTLGLFLLVINALVLMLASGLVPGFHVQGFLPAICAATLLALLGMAIRALTKQG